MDRFGAFAIIFFVMFASFVPSLEARKLLNTKKIDSSSKKVSSFVCEFGYECSSKGKRNSKRKFNTNLTTKMRQKFVIETETSKNLRFVP